MLTGLPLTALTRHHPTGSFHCVTVASSTASSTKTGVVASGDAIIYGTRVDETTLASKVARRYVDTIRWVHLGSGMIAGNNIIQYLSCH